MKPVIWSVAGNDSGGGAGLSADLRAAAAFGVHLCPVVAALTAQNSHAVTRVQVVAPDFLDAQLAALAEDMPPVVIKSGLLGSAENVAVLTGWVDRLREQAPVALVVDPVLSATSGGVAFADEALIAAYRAKLLPRATLVTPNLDEARSLVGAAVDDGAQALARALQRTGADAVVVTDGSGAGSRLNARRLQQSCDWMATPYASGWLALPRLQTFHTHGTGCTFSGSAASALALGFGVADALVLAKLATRFALARSHEAGGGRGPVCLQPGFAAVPEWLPSLTWGEELPIDPAGNARGRGHPPLREGGHTGLYAVVDSEARVQQVLQAGARTVQLRIKRPAAEGAGWQASLREALAHALAACRQADATLVVNDHWQPALELAGSDSRGLAVHLGQEDLLALTVAQRARLLDSGVPLGISSHSLWELARTRGMAPWYVACGPVWPTLTKDMPWRPQGLDNLAWWVRMAGVPVVAIGGVLEYEQATEAARSGAAAVCVVRGLGQDPAQSWPQWQRAVRAAAALPPLSVPDLPHPMLEPGHG